MKRLLIALAFASLWSANSFAQTEAVVGTGAVCDTAEQLRTWVEMTNAGIPSPVAMTQVNDQEGHAACGVLTVAYIRNEDIVTIEGNGGIPVTIAKITVIAVHDGGQFHMVPPLEQVTVFNEPAVPAPAGLQV